MKEVVMELRKFQDHSWVNNNGEETEDLMMENLDMVTNP